MKLFINRHNGFKGLYWCGAIKTLSLDLTETFGLHLRFEMNQSEQTELSRGLLSVIEEKDRVKALTNRQLVDEVLTCTDYADSVVVGEMMDRLDPGWYERDEAE